MSSFDQDAVDEAIRILQPQIDAIVAAPSSTPRNPVKYTIEYDDGSVDVFSLVP